MSDPNFNTSAEAGFLTPVIEPAQDDALTDLLHSTLQGLTGLPGEMVRPTWQINPPNRPDITTDWMAFGVPAESPDVFAYERHDPVGPSGQGANIVQRTVMLSVRLYFYGPNAAKYDARIRDGLQIGQNRDVLRAMGVSVVEHQPPVITPDLMKQQWYRKVESTLMLRRNSESTFNVLNVLTAQGVVNTDQGFADPFNTANEAQP